MKKIKLMAPILGIATLSSAVIPLVGCSCNQNISKFTINTDQVDKTNLGNPVCNFKYKETSTITFSPISGKALDVDSIEVQIGNATYKKDNLTINNNVVTIAGEKVDDYSITIKASAKNAEKQITALNVTCPKIEYTNQALTSSDVIVELVYDNGDKQTLNCDENGYKVSYQKDSTKTLVADFAVNGLTLTETGSYKIIFEYAKDSKWYKEIDTTIVSAFNKDKFIELYNAYTNGFVSSKKEYSMNQVKYRMKENGAWSSWTQLTESNHFGYRYSEDTAKIRECSLNLPKLAETYLISLANNYSLNLLLKNFDWTKEGYSVSISASNKIRFYFEDSASLAKEFIINKNGYIEKYVAPNGSGYPEFEFSYEGDMAEKRIINVEKDVVWTGLESWFTSVNNNCYPKISETGQVSISVVFKQEVEEDVKTKITVFKNQTNLQEVNYTFKKDDVSCDFKLSSDALSKLVDGDTINFKVEKID